jgi:beta-glucosidase
MASKFKLFAAGIFALAGSMANAQQSQAEIDKKVEALINKMNLEEKVGQMAQITLDVLCKGDNRYSSTQPLTLDDAEMKKVFGKYHI